MDTPTFRESVSDAIRFWEPRRLVYNALLSVIVLFYFFRAYPVSKAVLTLDSILGMFLLVVLANVALLTSPTHSLSGPRIVTSGGDTAGSCLRLVRFSREF